MYVLGRNKFKCFVYFAYLFFTSYSTDFGSVANKNIRNMHAVLTNQIEDILHIDDDDASNSLTTLRNP